MARTSIKARNEARGEPIAIDAHRAALNIHLGMTTPESLGSKQT